MQGASKGIVNIEDLSEVELRKLKERYQGLVTRSPRSKPSDSRPDRGPLRWTPIYWK